jgi:two-component system chemotaxis response regulator CheB
MSRPRIRVLVVDDSAFARKVLREVLSSAQMDVVGTARDGLEALEKIVELKPDVLTLDLMMPNLDGVGVLKAMPPVDPPRVVVVSMSGAESALGIEALHLGAIDIVQKPTALATDRLYELGAELREKVMAAAYARPSAPEANAAARAVLVEPAVHSAAATVDLVVIGTSTGGPQALTRLLTALPANFPVPLAIALHIPEGYTQGLAQRLDDRSQITVKEASEGMELRAGLAVLAPGGKHLRFATAASGLVVRLAGDREGAMHVPSVDVLFESAALEAQSRVLAVVLTGMGNDGLAGSRRLRAAGARIITEAESSCVVYGMPRSVHEAGLSNEVATLDGMAAAIVRNVMGRPGQP